MKHYFLAISVFIGIVPSLLAQNYRLQIAVFEKAVHESRFDAIKGDKTVRLQVDRMGFHWYFLDGFWSLEEVELKRQEAIQKGFLWADIIDIEQELARCPSGCLSSRGFPQEVYLNPILFKSSSSRLSSKAKKTLNVIYQILKNHPDYTILLGGHTDSEGSFDTNEQLSADRNQAVKNYFLARGIDKSRVKMEHFGESRPIAINRFVEDLTAPKGQHFNRRVDITIKNQSGYTMYTNITDRHIDLELRIRDDERIKDILNPHDNIATDKKNTSH